MNKIINISFPRSGHHLLVNILKKYFKDEIKYCEYYISNEGCGCFGGPNPNNVLCIKEETNFQKQHDFEKLFYRPRVFLVPKDLDRKYLILYRKNKYKALLSWYEMFLDDPNSKIEHSEEGFREFMSWFSNFYNKWVNKWVRDKEIKDKLTITYEDLTSDTVETIFEVIKFINGKPNRNKIKDSIIQHTVRDKRKLEDSDFYNILKEDYLDEK